MSYFVFLSFVVFYACVFSDPSEMDQAAGNRMRKTAQRNVRSKRPVTSSHQGPTQDTVEEIKPGQRLALSGEPTSPRLTSSSGTADPHSKETSGKNTDTAAVVANTDIKTKASNTDSNSAVLTENLEDTTIDLDEQTIMTYVLTLHYFIYGSLCD